MSAEQSIYRILAEDSSVTGYVDEKIYKDIIPQPDDLPAIVYSRTGTEPVQTIHGVNIAGFAQIQIQVWAKTRTSAEQIEAAVISALNAAGEPYTSRGALYDEETRSHGVALDVSLFET